MTNGFARGLLIGSIVGASVGRMMNPEITSSRNRRKMMRTGRTLLRKSGSIIGDVVDLFR